MKLSSIVVVALRFYAIHWFLQGFNSILPLAVSLAGSRVPYWTYLTPLPLLGFGLLCWFLAAPLGRIVTRGQDTDIPLGECTRLDLYSLAFILAGLWFTVNTFGPALNWIHYLLKTNAAMLDPERSSSLYNSATTFVTFITGAFLLFGARGWAQKLIRLQDASE